MKKNIPTLWPFFLILIIATALSLSPLGVRLEENIGLRLLFWLRGPVPAPNNVVVVSVDEDSAAQLDLPEPDELSQWPRSVHATVINRLKDLGVKAIAIDIAFHDSRENSSEDTRLANAIAYADNVVLLKLMQRFEVNNQNQTFSVEQVSLPAPQFRDSAKAVAAFTLPEDSIKKYAEAFKQTPDGLEPTMPLVALLVYAEDTVRPMADFIFSKINLAKINTESKDENSIKEKRTTKDKSLVELAVELRTVFEQNPKLLQSIEKEFPTHDSTYSHDADSIRAVLAGLTAQNPVYLNFYGPRHSITTIPYADFFNKADNELPDLKNKAVFIGLSENRTKQRDYFYTIFSGAEDRRFSGVEIAATLFANLSDNTQLRSPVGWQMLFIQLIIGGIIIGGLIWCNLHLWLVLSSATIVSYSLLWYIGFIQFHYWLPLVIPIFILAPLLLALGTALHHRQSVRLGDAAAATLQQYLPNDVALQMRDNVEKIQHQRQVTQGVCLLTDLVGFTTLAEQLSAAQLHELMNRYYDEITQIIQRHNGTIANIVGDGLLALWTGIELNNELKNSACRAALEIAKALKTPEFIDFKTCIGIHCGEISLGNLGAAGHFEYAPVGDTINTTARVEAYNRTLGTQVLLTDAVGADVRLFRTQYHGEVLFKGKTKAVGVYELLSAD